MNEATRFTLRDELAIKAMHHVDWLNLQAAEAAANCFEIADAMMAARSKNAPEDAGPWYPDDSGEWFEVPGDSMGMPGDLPDGGQTRLTVLNHQERTIRKYEQTEYQATDYYWSGRQTEKSRIVAYKILR